MDETKVISWTKLRIANQAITSQMLTPDGEIIAVRGLLKGQNTTWDKAQTWYVKFDESYVKFCIVRLLFNAELPADKVAQIATTAMKEFTDVSDRMDKIAADNDKQPPSLEEIYRQYRKQVLN